MGKRRHQRVQEALRSWAAALDKSIIGHRVDPPVIPKGAHLDVLRLWTRERDGVSGRAAGRLATLAVEAGLDRVAVEAVRSKTDGERLTGIEAAGRLGLDEVWDDLVRHLCSGRAPLWERAGVALVRISPGRALELLLASLVAGDVPASAPALARVIATAPESARTTAIGAVLFDLPPVAQACVLRALGSAPTPTLLPIVRRILRLVDVLDVAAVDIVAGCITALGAAGDASDAVRARGLATHPAWTVRLEAAVALGALDGDVRTLRAMASDDVEWLVRRAAVDSLRALGHDAPALGPESAFIVEGHADVRLDAADEPWSVLDLSD
jgi:hypothetical protein